MRKFKILAALICILSTLVFVGNVSARSNDKLSTLGKVSTAKKYTMYVGTNDKDTLKQEIPTEKAIEIMHEICFKYADGYTLDVRDGYYRNDKGQITHEVSLIYIFIDTPLQSVKKIMDEALVKLNQESILLEESESKSIFYSAKK